MDAKTKALLDKQIKSEISTLKKEFKKVLLGGMPKMDNLKIVSLEGKKLVLKTNVKAVKKMSSPDKLYRAIDGVEFGRGNKIPLWLFGFLY